MHELSLTQSIIDICRQHAGDKRVLAVTLEIGDLSGVLPEAIEFCFEACTSGTSLEGARLVIERIAPAGRCRECGTAFSPPTLHDPCPSCGGYRIELQAGEELRVRELEVES